MANAFVRLTVRALDGEAYHAKERAAEVVRPSDGRVSHYGAQEYHFQGTRYVCDTWQPYNSDSTVHPRTWRWTPFSVQRNTRM